jgi:hypothetical protein
MIGTRTSLRARWAIGLSLVTILTLVAGGAGLAVYVQLLTDLAAVGRGATISAPLIWTGTVSGLAALLGLIATVKWVRRAEPATVPSGPIQPGGPDPQRYQPSPQPYPQPGSPDEGWTPHESWTPHGWPGYPQAPYREPQYPEVEYPPAANPLAPSRAQNLSAQDASAQNAQIEYPPARPHWPPAPQYPTEPSPPGTWTR